jgi:hypothetical protein
MGARLLRMGLLAVILLVVVLSVGRFFKASRSWSVVPLPISEWGFYILYLDGPTEVTEFTTVGCVALYRSFPGGHLVRPSASTRSGTVR